MYGDKEEREEQTVLSIFDEVTFKPSKQTLLYINSGAETPLNQFIK